MRRGETDALRLLGDLVDRHERATDRTRRITAFPAMSFAGPDERDALIGGLRAAADAGAIELDWDRDAPHLVRRVVLRDAERLCRHLGRRTADAVIAAALATLEGANPTTGAGGELKTLLSDAWRSGGAALGIGPGQADEGAWLVRAADAAFAPSEARLPLRTRSARSLGDSKALERALPRLLAFAKQSGMIDPILDRDDALRALGLEKFAQPVLVAGPLRVRGAPVGSWAYAGLAPEDVDGLDVKGALGAVLTVENLESFNRHVREARRADEAVVYTGGFPARGVVAAIRRLVEAGGVDAVHHWGDVDAGGVAIGRYLEEALPVPVRPHLMSPALARMFGKPAPPATPNSDARGAFGQLAAFLASDEAHALEQEVLDPQPIALAGRAGTAA